MLFAQSVPGGCQWLSYLFSGFDKYVVVVVGIPVQVVCPTACHPAFKVRVYSGYHALFLRPCPNFVTGDADAPCQAFGAQVVAFGGNVEGGIVDGGVVAGAKACFVGKVGGGIACHVDFGTLAACGGCLVDDEHVQVFDVHGFVRFFDGGEIQRYFKVGSVTGVVFTAYAGVGAVEGEIIIGYLVVLQNLWALSHRMKVGLLCPLS